MIRGPRHDGIPNNQSSRDRDKQRERQRQERQQMLPNDDKDVTANTKDLFNPPRQVKPSDPMSLEISKTLGNFETVRHMLDKQSQKLIGVDQQAAAAASGTQSATSGGNNSLVDKQRLAVNPAGPGSSHNPKVSTQPSHRNFVQGPGPSGVPSAQSITSSPNLYRPSSNLQKVPQIQSQPQPQPLLRPPIQNVNQVVNANQVVNTTHLHHTINASNTSGLSSTHTIPLRNFNSTLPNYTHTHLNNSGSSNSEVAPVREVLDAKVDKINNSSSALGIDKSIRSSVPNAGVPNDRSLHNNKPALERADSQLELESMLKEMMDVKSPLTAIQTPMKEPIKKITQRRSSKEENVVQSMACNPVTNPLQKSSPKSPKMESSDSSSNGDSSSESDSDTSSGSQAGEDNLDSIAPKNIPPVNSPPRIWDLGTIITHNLKKNDNSNIKGTPDSSVLSKSPMDLKLRKNLYSTKEEESVPDVPAKLEPSVTSTSPVFEKSLSASPVEPSNIGLPHLSKVPGKSPRRTPDVRPNPYIPAKPPIANQNTTKVVSKPISQAASQGRSLSGSSSEEETEKPQKELPPPRIPIPEPKLPPPVISPVGRKRPRKKSSSSSDRTRHKSEDDSSPETKPKSKKVVQDRNKNDMIGKLFRGRKKEGKKVEISNIPEKVIASGTSSTAAGAKNTSGNRVSGKDSGKKSANSTANVKSVTPPASLVQNGELETSSLTSIKSGKDKKKESTKSATAKSAPAKAKPPQPHGSKRRRLITDSPTRGSAESQLPPLPPEAAGAKVSAPARLICRIPLDLLPRKILPIPPLILPPPQPLRSVNLKPPAPPPTKPPKRGSSKTATTAGQVSSKDDTNRVKLHYDSSRVGSSSDHANDTHGPAPRKGKIPLVVETVCPEPRLSTDSEYKRARRKSRSNSTAQKKSKVRLEPDSHSKIDDDSALACEVSSNVIGYTASTCDQASVSTSRKSPVEAEAAQAPDSSLNPPHLPSPVVQHQVQFYSYFDKIEHNDSEDYFTRGQEAYLDEAKRLKHKADREESGTQAQASTYLEAGLYFILAGTSIEGDRATWSREAFTMYKDTLNLIRFIGSRFRNRQDNTNEAKITVLSLRCQSLLAVKLFKMKMKETKEVAQYLNDHFQKAPPVDVHAITNSPHLSTPSPHSPTSSPAGSSGILLGLNPSPHHPHQNHQVPTVAVSRSMYGHMYKHCSNTTNIVSAHEMWDAADSLVEKYHLQEFFISIDRIYGPLTLHTPLIDLVRYVRHGLGVLKDIS